MTKSSDHFKKEFEPHSQYKHLILKTYFEAWGRKLLLRRDAGNSVLYVDACAGLGMDSAGNHGSPLIAAKAAVTAQAQLRNEFKRAVEIKVIAIEKKRSFFKALKENLAPFGSSIRVINEDFAAYLPTIDAEFAGTPTLYFIDPFGLEPLRADAVRRALSGERNEVLVLFHDEAALRHFGAVISQETKRERELRDHEQQPWLIPEMHEEHRKVLAGRAAKSKASLDISRERGVEILNAALGRTDWLHLIDNTRADQRAAKFLELYIAFLKSCGTTYVLPFPIFNADGDHVYFLVHASKSAKGYTTMKEAVHYALGHGPLPPDVVANLRSHLDVSIVDVEAVVRRHFAGQRIRWSPDPDDKSAPCIRTHVLEETPLFPHQALDLRQKLAPFRDLSFGRSHVYRFPERDA